MRSSSASNSASESSENRFASADAVNDMSNDYAGLPKPRSSNATAALMRADSDLPALAIFTKVRSAEKAYDLGAERGPHPLDPTVHGDKAHGFEHPHSRDHGEQAHRRPPQGAPMLALSLGSPTLALDRARHKHHTREEIAVCVHLRRGAEV